MSRATEPDPNLPAAITRTERRLGMLERMADIGMQLVEQIGAHAAAAGAAINEGGRGDPARAFAVVSRAVRLTLAMEARVDRRILALRNGELFEAEDAPWARRPRVAPPHEDVEDRLGYGELYENLTDRDPVEAIFLQATRPTATAVSETPGLAREPVEAMEEVGAATYAPVVAERQADQARPPIVERRLE